MTFSAIGRILVFLWLLPLFVVPGLDVIYSKFPEDTEFYWFNIFYFYYYYSLLALALIIFGKVYSVNWSKMFAEVSLNDYFHGLKLTVFVFFFSLAAAYLLFYPLSFLLPKFVVYWYLSTEPIIYLKPDSFPILPNLLSFFALVVLAPIVEEFLFRGYLLHRFSSKWNLRTGIILSSLIFGLIHSDPIGAVVFGIAMCFIYLRTQSLIVPIVCHVFNNFLVWSWELYYVIRDDSMLWPQTIEEFRADWQLNFVAGMVAFIWIITYLRSKTEKRKLSLPELGESKA